MSDIMHDIHSHDNNNIILPQHQDTGYGNGIVSGELLYQINNISIIGKNLYPDIHDDFWEFMRTSIDLTTFQQYQQHKGMSNQVLPTMSSSSSSSASIKLSSLIKINYEIYIMKLKHHINDIQNIVHSTNDNIITEIKLENEKLKIKIDDLLHHYESHTMQCILQYYNIIKKELDSSRIRLLYDRLEKQILIKQAEILYQLRLFSSHLIIETKGKIFFSITSYDSQQYIRCVKAIKDNVNIEKINNSNLNIINIIDFKMKTKVLNVFKLQNGFLSRKLQVTNSNYYFHQCFIFSLSSPQ
jgi:hypothetical protein